MLGTGWRRCWWRTGRGEKRQSCRNWRKAMLTDGNFLFKCTHSYKPGNDYLIWQESYCGEEQDTKKINVFSVSQAGLLRLALSCWLLWVTSCRAAAFCGVKTSNLYKDKQLNQSRPIRKRSWFSPNPDQLVTHSCGQKHPLNSSATHERNRFKYDFFLIYCTTHGNGLRRGQIWEELKVLQVVKIYWATI